VSDSILAQWICKGLEQVAVVVNLQLLQLSVKNGLDPLKYEALTDLEVLLQDINSTGRRDQPDEAHITGSQRKMVSVERELGRQLAQSLASAVLRRGLEPQRRSDLRFVGRCHQMAQLAAHIGWTAQAPTQRQGLKPAVRMLNRTIPLWPALRNEHRPDADPQAKANDPAEPTRRMTEPTELAPIVELHVLGQAQALPGMDQKPDHGAHLAANDPLQIIGAIEHVPKDQKVVVSRAAEQVAGPDLCWLRLSSVRINCMKVGQEALNRHC